ncbi:protein kinase [Streptomyces sp. NPDC051180]|uniref:protein kinase n=1 Tax=Streptomyces sp. NPDC051180 TaxID=3155797 RepID=UPI00344B1EDD
MDDYAGRVLADRYRLPLPPADADTYALAETRAFDTYSGQEVMVRQVPLPEFVDAEVLDGDGGPADPYGSAGRATRRPAEPVVRRAIEAAQAAAQIPDHPLLDQVFDVFAEAGSLWIVSEVVAARPLAALLAERPLNPYRAAEIGADVLTALRALHAHGWVHRNITARTVLVCDDGRVVLTGLAAGAAEEALCGYAPVPTDTEPPAPDPFASGPFDTAAAEPEPSEPEPSQAGPFAIERFAPDPYAPEPYAPAPYEPEPATYESPALRPYAPEPHAPERYEPQPYEPQPYEPGPYAQEPYAPEWHAPTEEYGTEIHGTEIHEAEVHEGAIHEDEIHEDGGPGDADADGPPGGAPAVGASWDDDAQDDEDPDPYDDAPYGTAPYGSDPYGRATPAQPAATQPAAAPPTADVRAARAGAIAAYRAGARAAARLGETGALPAQRPVPPDAERERGPEPEAEAGPSEVPPPRAPAAPPGPQWWSQVDDEDDDEDDGDEPYGGGPRQGPPPRVMLAGSWSDGPHASRDGSGPVPAGGGSVLPGSGRPALPAGYTAAAPEPARLPAPASPRDDDGERAGVPAPAHRGPTTRLDAERARQTRIAVVGAVTERWAPEQAGPVHENWRLAPPIGPATDLWALGALLYRAVQGHAPYPEDSAAELVQLVCAEPPAFAEECGPLRPVVESLLRQDPTERPDFEELRGWLRSLVRSAPEPDAGVGVVPLPSFDETRLPIVRRRGELVRRWRGGAGAGRHRHKRAKEPRAAARREEVREHDRAYEHGVASGPDHGGGPVDHPGGFREEYAEYAEYEEYREEIPQRAPRAPRAPRSPSARGADSPRSLGRTLLILVFVLLGGAVAYAVFLMPGKGEDPTGATGSTAGATPTARPGGTSAGPTAGPSGGPTGTPSAKPPTTPPAADPSGPAPAAGYTVRQDPEGFRIGVPNGWRRSPINDAGQVRYTNGDFTMIVVPGRDSVRDNGGDPLEYQSSRERELEPWRASSWSGAERTRRVDIGRTATATGSYWWLDGSGREVFVRNLALIDGGRYHVVQVIGPYTERDKVSAIHEEATRAFRP